MRNVTTTRRPGAAPGRRAAPVIAVVAVVLVLLFIVQSCSHHENKYEKIAREFTTAVQANDMTAVDKLENAETQTRTTHGRLGAAADRLAPLGKVKNVKETTSASAAPGNHQFLVTFDKGEMTERFRFDKDDKVFSFDYQPPAQGS